jgi:hypothetical protein
LGHAAASLYFVHLSLRECNQLMDAGVEAALRVTAPYRVDCGDDMLLWSTSKQHAERLFRAG